MQFYFINTKEEMNDYLSVEHLDLLYSIHYQLIWQ